MYKNKIMMKSFYIRDQSLDLILCESLENILLIIILNQKCKISEATPTKSQTFWSKRERKFTL